MKLQVEDSFRDKKRFRKAEKIKNHQRMVNIFWAFGNFQMAIFLTVLTLLITRKIVAEHKIYEKIGGYVVNTWEYFGLFKEGAYIAGKTILDEDAKRYGTGSGYKKTIHILWAMMIMADIILAVFVFIK